LVLRTIHAAKAKEAVAAELQLHSDQGFQYTSHAYFALTREYGITPSMSRRGNPYDNAPAENFFSILKTECLRRHKPQSIAHAKQLIDNFIYFYNNERIQLKTKLTPLEKRRQFMQS
jgi:transposase InsO family protein